MKRRYIPWLLGALPFVGISLALAVPAFRSDSGIQFSSEATSGVAAGKGGLWWDGSATGPLWRKADGSDVRVLTANSVLSAPGIDRSNAGTFAVCDTNCTTLTLGRAGIAITGSPGSYSMTPSGALTLTAGMASTWDSRDGAIKAATLDRTTAGTLTIGGTANALVIADNVSNIVMGNNSLTFGGTVANKFINVAISPSDTAGSQLALASGSAGPAVTANGKAGGVLNLTTGGGGTGSGAFTGGASGAWVLATGAGGAGTATAAAGPSANITIQPGPAGANNGGGGAITGNLNWNIGMPTGAAAQGRVNFQNNGTTEIAYYPVLHALVSNTPFTAFLGGIGAEFGAVYARHYHGGGTAPAIAVGSAGQLGTGATTAVTVGSDASGTIVFTSGTGPTAFVANTVVTVGTVTFSSSYIGGAPRGIVLTPSGNTSAILTTGASEIAFYAEQSATASQFIIKAVSAGTPSLTASTAYPFAYMVIQ